METEKTETKKNDWISLVSAFDTAKGIIEELQTEIEEWRDNLDNANMSHLPKYEEVDRCASELSDVIDSLENLELEWPSPEEASVYPEALKVKNKMSRADRMTNAIALLDAVKSEAESVIETVQEVIDTLDEISDTAGSLEFPRAFN